MKRIIFIFFLLVSSFDLYSQNKKTIWIKDNTNESIENIAIFNSHNLFLGVTGNNGAITFNLSGDSLICSESIFYKDTCFKVNKDTFYLKPNLFSLNQVTVSEKTDIDNLLWSKLKYNKEQLVNDTDLFYSFNFSMSVPDSNWQETISGTFQIHIAFPEKNKMKIFLCNCNYTENGQITIKTYLNLLGISPKDLFVSYMVFSVFKNKNDLKNFKIKQDSGYYNLEMTSPKVSSFKQLSFHKKDLIKSFSQVFYYKKYFNYQILYQKTVYTFFKKDGILFPESVNYLNAYKHKNMLANTSITFQILTTKPESCKKIGMNSGNPLFIYEHFKKIDAE